MKKESMFFFGIIFITLLFAAGVFGYERARTSITETCLEKGTFTFQGTRYDCEIHTVP